MRTSNHSSAGLTRFLGTLILACTVIAGCDSGPATGDVTGSITVDGQVPPAGSSISFMSADGKTAVAGATLENGKYSTRVPVGTAKVQIRAPKVIGKAKSEKDGYQSQGELVEEMLPEKFNDNTELTLEVKPGKNEKNWDLKTK